MRSRRSSLGLVLFRMICHDVTSLLFIIRSINGRITAMLSILSDSQKAVLDTIVMKLKLNQSLEYMEHLGHKISERTYYRQRKQIHDIKLKRFIAKVAYEEQHLESHQNGID